jgi:hypothetical protein
MRNQPNESPTNPVRINAFMPVESLVYALAGRFRYLGTTRKSTPMLLACLLDPQLIADLAGPARVGTDQSRDDRTTDAEDIVVGTPLSRRCTPPRKSSDESFPSELRILNTARAGMYRERVREATRRYRAADERFTAELTGFSYRNHHPDAQDDETVFAELAQLAAVYDVLVDPDTEILTLVTYW